MAVTKAHRKQKRGDIQSVLKDCSLFFNKLALVYCHFTFIEGWKFEENVER